MEEQVSSSLVGTDLVGTDLVGTDLVGTDLVGKQFGEHAARCRTIQPSSDPLSSSQTHAREKAASPHPKDDERQPSRSSYQPFIT
ncbi:pentapeptide repeat-containing protein [Paenibacillus sp. BK720]|uniref:pentapeptide repeat-containing protein n=1 Tax=Paenibacillus sp. BK720 TaxID=2587092 RepID=UPI001ABA6F57|nr:pentapeptide repeat-containing protein [Paenibacillus sp. BK720]